MNSTVTKDTFDRKKAKISADPSQEFTRDATILQSIDRQSNTMKQTKLVIVLAYILLIGLGVATGFLLSGQNVSMITTGSGATVAGGNKEKTTGVSDATTFKDSAEGVIQKGGIDGEGTHKLIRDGGPSQTAYLVSSVIDLDQYVDKKVKVWGQTLAAQKAAWLLDVGKIEVK